MANSKKGTPAPEAAVKEDVTNVSYETISPEEQAAASERIKSIAELQAQLKLAKQAWTEANIAADYEETAEVISAQAAVNKARQALKAAEASEAKAEAERILSEKMNHAISEIKSVFNLDDAGIESIKTAANAENSTLRTSIALVFGNKPVHAKEGQSGKSLTQSSGVPRGGKSAEIEADLVSGMTYAELLAKYPTADNPNKLNGTARTVIANGGWKKQDNGSYLKA